MRQMGNTASNLIWNPDERRNPPPTSQSGSDDRDGELEKFIRRKYEQGAFKAGVNTAGLAAPTSMNRARAAGAAGAGAGVRSGMVRSTSWKDPNPRNPELSDVLIGKEKDLPRLPQPAPMAVPAQNAGPSQPPRQRPVPSRGNTPQPTGTSGTGSLIDMSEGTSATMPLQMTGYGGAGQMGQGGQMGTGGQSWGNQPTFAGSSSPFQQPQYQQYPQQAFSAPQQYPAYSQYPLQSTNPFGSSYISQQSAFPAQMQQQTYQQQSFLPVPQQQQQYGGMGTSPGGMGMSYGGQQGSSPGRGAFQGGGSWQGGMAMNGGMVYGQGMR